MILIGFIDGVKYPENFVDFIYGCSPQRAAPEEGHTVSLDFVSHGRRFRLDLQRDHEALRDGGFIPEDKLRK